MPISFPSVIRAHKVVVSDWLQMLKAAEKKVFLQVSMLYEYIFFIFQIIKRSFHLAFNEFHQIVEVFPLDIGMLQDVYLVLFTISCSLLENIFSQEKLVSFLIIGIIPNILQHLAEFKDFAFWLFGFFLAFLLRYGLNVEHG